MSTRPEPNPCPRWCDGDHRHGGTRHAGIVGAVPLDHGAAYAVVLVQRNAAPEPRVELIRDRDGQIDVTSMSLDAANYLFQVLAGALVEAGLSPSIGEPPSGGGEPEGDAASGWSALMLPPQNAGGFPTPWTMVRHA